MLSTRSILCLDFLYLRSKRYCQTYIVCGKLSIYIICTCCIDMENGQSLTVTEIADELLEKLRTAGLGSNDFSLSTTQVRSICSLLGNGVRWVAGSTCNCNNYLITNDYNYIYLNLTFLSWTRVPSPICTILSDSVIW